MYNTERGFRFLLNGIDTIEVCYYLTKGENCLIDYVQLLAKRDWLKLHKGKATQTIQLGSEAFLLSNHGTNTGHSLFMENEVFEVAFGEFIQPSFFVKFRCSALWHDGLDALHERFLKWASSVGLQQTKPEVISRVDLAFDYQINAVDFDIDSFVSTADIDKQYRRNGTFQTFDFGSGDVKVRIYNKSDEIRDKSGKIWFHNLWGDVSENVWRIEWQLRKEALRPVGIKTVSDLKERQGDVLRNLATCHTTLRLPTEATDRRAWPLHPLWSDYLDRIDKMPAIGIVRAYDSGLVLDERLLRCLISMYGYMKRIAAIQCVKHDLETVDLNIALIFLRTELLKLHDRMIWETGVSQRVQEMRFGHE